MIVFFEMVCMMLGNFQLIDGIYFIMMFNVFIKFEEKFEWCFYFVICCFNGIFVLDLIWEGFYWFRKNIIIFDIIYYYDEKNSCQCCFWYFCEFVDEFLFYFCWIMQIVFQFVKLEICVKFCFDDIIFYYCKIQYVFVMLRMDMVILFFCIFVMSLILLLLIVCWRMWGRIRI